MFVFVFFQIKGTLTVCIDRLPISYDMFQYADLYATSKGSLYFPLNKYKLVNFQFNTKPLQDELF